MDWNEFAQSFVARVTTALNAIPKSSTYCYYDDLTSRPQVP